MQAFAGLFSDHRYAKALLAVELLKNPALLKLTNSARFQRINFVKAEIYLNFLKIF